MKLQDITKIVLTILFCSCLISCKNRSEHSGSVTSKTSKQPTVLFNQTSFTQPFSVPDEIDKELKVIRISPFGSQLSYVSQIVFQFSGPVIALQKNERDHKVIPMSFLPGIECSWSWISSDTLACQINSQLPLISATQYRIGLRDLTAQDSIETKQIWYGVMSYLSEAGKNNIKIQQGDIIATETPQIRYAYLLEWQAPGVPIFQLSPSQKLSGQSVIEHLFFIDANQQKIKVKILNDYQPKEEVSPEASIVYVQPEVELNQNSLIKLNVEPGLQSIDGTLLGTQNETITTFSTHRAAEFLGVSCCSNEAKLDQDQDYDRCGYTYKDLTPVMIKAGSLNDDTNLDLCNPQSTVSLVFSSPVSKEALLEALSITPSLTANGDLKSVSDAFYSSADLFSSVSSEGYKVSLPTGLPENSDFNIIVKSLKDMFGRTIPDFATKFKTSQRLPRLVVDTSEFLLEKNVDTHLPSVVQNLNNINFNYAAITADKKWSENKSIAVDNIPGVSYFFPIKIRDILGSSGFISGNFTSQDEIRNYDKPGGEYDYRGQVTPFHIQAKIGHFNSLVWVTDLTTGKAVENAQVMWLFNKNDSLPDPSGNAFATASTDSEGFAFLPGISSAGKNNKLYDGRSFIVVKKDSDIGYTNLNYPSKVSDWVSWEKAYGHMKFWGMTPQGVYKKGQTVEYKIIARNQDVNGLIAAPRHGYLISVVDPLGKTINTVENVSLTDFGTYSGSFFVPQNAPTGMYEVKVRANFAPGYNDNNQKNPKGREFSVTQVLVSDFTPAPFKVNTEIKPIVYTAGESVSTKLSANLHAGGPVLGAKAQIRAKLSGRMIEDLPPSIEKFFIQTTTPTEDSEYDSQTIEDIYSADRILDNNGSYLDIFTIPNDTKLLYADLLVEGTVEDDRGKKIANMASSLFAARDRFAGIYLPSWSFTVNQPAHVEAVVIDQNKNILTGSAITVIVERDETYATQVKGAGNAYLTKYENRKVKEKECQLTSGKDPVKCPFSPTTPGDYTFTALVTDTKGRIHTSQTQAYVLGKGDLIWRTDDTKSIDVIPEKKNYLVGEVAKLLVKNPFPGAQALITVERYGVISKSLQVLQDAAASIQIPVTQEMVPGAYVSVSVFSPRVDKPVTEGQIDLGKPAVRYGVAQLAVSESVKQLEVQVKPNKEEYKPQELITANISVKGASDGAEVAVAVLDEAVFDLILKGREYFNPMKRLYSLDSHEVETFDNIMHLVGRRSFPKKGANSGGDGISESTRKDLKYVAYWNPAVPIDTNGNATITFKAPDNLTSWRIFAVALNKTDKAGFGEAKVSVSKEIELRSVMTEEVISGDTFNAAFTVLNRTKQHTSVSVSLRSESKSLKTPLNFSTQVTVAPFERKIVSVPINAISPGKIDVSAQVQVPGSAIQDGVSATVLVSPKVDYTTAASYLSSDTGSIQVPIKVDEDIDASLSTISVTLSPTILTSVSQSFKYMSEYPYQCWEQKLSKAVSASQYSLLHQYISDYQWDQAKTLPNHTLKEAAQYQAPNGGFAYYQPRNDLVDPYLSAYTSLSFNWLAENGHKVTDSISERLDDYLKKLLNENTMPSYYSLGAASTVRALILQSLALRGVVKDSDVKRFYEFTPQMSLLGKAAYLRALQLVGDSDKEQKTVVSMLMNAMNETGSKLQFIEPITTTQFDRILTTSIRDNCAIASALISAKDTNTVFAQKLMRMVSETKKSSGHWSNTQENLFCSQAMIDYSKRFESVPVSGKWNISVDNKSFGSASFTKNIDPSLSVKTGIAEDQKGKSLSLSINSDNGKGRLYAQTVLTQAQTTLSNDPVNKGIEVVREYSKIINGKNQILQPGDILQQGDLIKVDLYVSLQASRNFVVVSDPIPGGFEAVNTNLATASTFDAANTDTQFAGGSYWGRFDGWIDFATNRWSFYHKELNRSSAQFYSDFLPAGRYHLSYVVQAVAHGQFTALGTIAQEMYEVDTYGKGVPFTINIAH